MAPVLGRFTTVRNLIRTYSILLVALPILLSSLVFLLHHRNVLVAAKGDEIRARLKVQATAIDKWMQDRLRNAVFLASLPEVERGDMAAFKPIAEAFIDADLDATAVVVVGADGLTTLDTSAPTGLNVSDRTYFKVAREGHTDISDVIIGRTSGKPIVIFSAPVKGRNGTFKGALFLPVRLTTISGQLSRGSLGLKGGIFLVSEKGELLSEFVPDDETPGPMHGASMFSTVSGGLIEAFREGRQPSGSYQGADGSDVVGAWVRISSKPWILAGEQPESEVVSGALTAFGVSLAAAVLSILIFTPLLIRLSDSIQRPIEQLVEFSESMKDGQYDYTCKASPPIGSPTEVTRLFDSFCSLGETIHETITTLETSSVTDQLTGCHNRRYLMQEGERQAAIAERGGHPLGVLMLDLDYFKQLNDTFGHQAGDAVLVEFAKHVGETVRGSDIFARLGGEEFCVLAPDSDEAHSTILAERIRHRVESMTVEWEGRAIGCTVSIGVAQICTSGADALGKTSLECGLAQADRALYEAKRRGRNQVVAASRMNSPV